MIIFPYGFFILEDRSPVYVGNDLAAQSVVRAWLDANPEQVELGFDVIGPVEVRTRFLGWDDSTRSSSMDSTPSLFESRMDGVPEIAERRRAGDHGAALAVHAEFVEVARGWLQGRT